MSFIQHYEKYLIQLSHYLDEYWDSIKNVKQFPFGTRPTVNIVLTDTQVYIVLDDSTSTLELLDIYKNTYVVAKNTHIIDIDGVEFYYLDENKLRVTSCSQLLRQQQTVYNYLLSNESHVILTSIANFIR